MLYRHLWLLTLATVVAVPAVFADPDKDESGQGRHRGHERKESFWQGDCKIERKWKKNGDYKEERKCGRGERHGARKEEFRDGHCKVKRKWEDGEYKEERKCKGRAQAQRPVQVVPAPAVVVYPPWIVMEQGQRTYHPQYEPRPVARASRCNSRTVGQVLGGIVGGALGTQIGKGNGRTAATIGGAVAGVLVGGEIGKRMDAADQGCIGEVLEVAPVNRRVQWVDGSTQYVVVPGKVVSRQGAYCRPYTVEVTIDGHRERSDGLACRRADGSWVAA